MLAIDFVVDVIAADEEECCSEKASCTAGYPSILIYIFDLNSLVPIDSFLIRGRGHFWKGSTSASDEPQNFFGPIGIARRRAGRLRVSRMTGGALELRISDLGIITMFPVKKHSREASF